MALPKVDQSVIDNVEEAEKEEVREKALAQNSATSRRKPKPKPKVELTPEDIKAAAKAELRKELEAEMAAEAAAETKDEQPAETEPEPEPELTTEQQKAIMKEEMKAEMAAEAKVRSGSKQEEVEEEYAEQDAQAAKEQEQKQDVQEKAVQEETAVESETKVLQPATSNLPAQAVQVSDPVQSLIDMGFASADGDMALNLDFTSFPMVVLKKGEFKTSEESLGTEFEFLFMQKRKTFLYRGNIDDRDAEAELLYTNDHITATMGDRTVAETTAEWDAKGWKWEVKDYYLLMGSVVGGDMDGEIVQLSIPSSSIGRFDGYMMVIACRNGDPSKVVTRVIVGKEVGSGTRAFNPWRFKLAGK